MASAAATSDAQHSDVIMAKSSPSKAQKQAVITLFSALELADMPIVLEQLREIMLKHPMQPAFNVKSRPATKEEISRAPLEHIFHWDITEDNKNRIVKNFLLENCELFQLGVPFNVKFEPFRSGGRDSEASYSGEVKFSLLGLAGKHVTDLHAHAYNSLPQVLSVCLGLFARPHP